jgi:hypothetical protein
MQVGRMRVGDAMYYADDMMMGSRRKKRGTNIVYEINQDNNFKSQEMGTELAI